MPVRVPDAYNRAGRGFSFTARMRIPPPAAISVLIADDHPAIRGALRGLLAGPAYRILGEAADGHEAVELAGRLGPDIVLLDLSMPVMGGLEAARIMARRLPGTGILIVSADAHPELVQDAFRAGARGYVLKDDCGAELAPAVSRVHQGGAFLSARIAGAMPPDWSPPLPP